MMARFKAKFEDLVSSNLYKDIEDVKTLNKLLSLGKVFFSYIIVNFLNFFLFFSFIYFKFLNFFIYIKF